jgi:hydroxypyruvate reductase
MSLPRSLLEQVFAAACRACDPERAVADWLRANPPEPRRRFGIAIGKAAIAMARGAGPVHRGLVVTPDTSDVALPAGWSVLVSSHPVPDERSVAAADAVIALVEAAGEGDLVLALISGGTSALVESPLVPLADFVALTSALMARGAPIAELNTVRGALSAIKAGGLALRSRAPIMTLVTSDVIGDDPRVIGSGPTIAADPELAEAANDNATHVANDNENAATRPDVALRRIRAREILEEHHLEVPAILTDDGFDRETLHEDRSADRVALVLPMACFAEAVITELAKHTNRPVTLLEPIATDAASAAEVIAKRVRGGADDAIVVAWGEPTVTLPTDHGEGGRAQQLALMLAKQLRGTERSALAIGSDGNDGPPPRDRPTPAGAFVDGATWDRIPGAEAALARCDAGSVLASIGALVVTGSTGINHADVVIVG